MTGSKRILMVPMNKAVEALRMASGLTLLDDQVAIALLDALPTGPDTDEQLEALEFADVPIEDLHQDLDGLAQRIIDSDVVFVV